MNAQAPAARFSVVWHPQAVSERDGARPKGEVVAMLNAAEKLAALGGALGFPHSSAVQGSELEGLRELRPRRGRSRWRPLYVQAGEHTFVVLAVGPEAAVDRRGFERAVRAAKARADAAGGV